MPWHRSAPALILGNGQTTGPLTDTEVAALNEAYGEPTVLDTSSATRMQAGIRVLMPIVVVLGAVGLGLFLLRRSRRQRRTIDDSAESR